MGTIDFMGSWLFRNWHGNGLNGEAYVLIPPFIDTGLSLRLPLPYVLVHTSARHGDGRVSQVYWQADNDQITP
jgi:hypothetical protein